MRSDYTYFDQQLPTDAPQVSSSQLKMAWKTLVSWFWGYTEETGKADTSSYDGLL